MKTTTTIIKDNILKEIKRILEEIQRNKEIDLKKEQVGKDYKRWQNIIK